ncbi:hypothetical protein [Paenibacillus thiaminolyticus]|uniref:Uncharacterized protein n=1 Tax=Paenibacillus thiaminolyticus TaxID=49283 RepID=A0A3A3H0D6_PANTH|nr:hypothetical protein [Paenibacillus thiaminolyticus]RJG22146.1 hypothetical protein DQX05_18805 [Paenibacillus thiaminolyticus]
MKNQIRRHGSTNVTAEEAGDAFFVLPASLVIYDYVRYPCGDPIEPIEMATMVIRLSVAKLVILILLPPADMITLQHKAHYKKGRFGNAIRH